MCDNDASDSINIESGALDSVVLYESLYESLYELVYEPLYELVYEPLYESLYESLYELVYGVLYDSHIVMSLLYESELVDSSGKLTIGFGRGSCTNVSEQPVSDSNP